MRTDRRLFSKRFGQVLLKNVSIAEFEVRSLDVFPDCRVLEIGGGEGVLTELLLEKDVNLDCVEPDGRFVEFLSQRFSKYLEIGRLRIIKRSFLDIEPGKYDRIIGNIPYHISSDIIFSLSRFEFEHAVLMVQKDFAERMIALPGQEGYSRLSVNCSYRFDTKIVRIVSRDDFNPVPKVDSAVIILKPKRVELGIEPKLLDDILVKLFSNRRKMVGTVIKECPEGLKEKRPGELTLDDFISVAKSLNRRP